MLRPFRDTPRQRHPLDRRDWPEDQHVMLDWEHHEPSSSCPCCPYVSYENPVTRARVWTHRVTN